MTAEVGKRRTLGFEIFFISTIKKLIPIFMLSPPNTTTSLEVRGNPYEVSLPTMLPFPNECLCRAVMPFC